jgi:hypothetical protein
MPIQLGLAELPKDIPSSETEDEELLKLIHEVLLEVCLMR